MSSLKNASIIIDTHKSSMKNIFMSTPEIEHTFLRNISPTPYQSNNF